MAAKTIKRSKLDNYLRLVQEFPLTHIRDERHLDAAQAVIDRLLQQKLNKGAQEYLDVLTDLVEAYEEDHYRLADVSEADVLRELMRANGLNQVRLAKKTGISQSTISAVLTGARSLTKEQVVTLARFFHVAPGAFLPE
jgi:HTH-type transcriptional regulator/antitoxin HigA